MNRRILLAAGLIGASALVITGCGSSSSTADTSGGDSSAPAGVATGSGASFPAPAYTQWCQDSQTCSYLSKGSGAGIKDRTSGVVAWAGSDAPLNSDETAAVKGTVLYFPTLLGAVTIPTNIDGITKPINLTGAALAGIFDGEITTWNDKDIATSNPGVTLPAKPIAVCVRADSSGTSYNFSGYLSQISQGFADKVGAEPSKTPAWTATVSASPGNSGVANCVKNGSNSIGYVDLADAKQAGLDGQAAAIGVEGAYMAPTIASIEAAGADAQLNPDLTVSASLSNSPAKGAYPIVATTYALAVEGGADNAAVKKALTYFLGAKAQGQLAGLGYAPLPSSMLSKATAQLSKLG
ncbi:MAG: phosphate ABC transporter substrate-binding protein PstS [Actinomycetota bacterium]|nr:phosphate ABC transporter substrate-binding protein PstS [Actinomycetota bacterium]